MLINCFLLSTITLITTVVLPNVSATPNTIDNITSGNKTNLSNPPIPPPSSASINHRLIYEIGSFVPSPISYPSIINYSSPVPSLEDNQKPQKRIYAARSPLEDFEYTNRIIP